jgi:methyl-accepting chemotaxis protein
MLMLRHLTISRKLWILILLAITGILTTTALALMENHAGLIKEKQLQTQRLESGTRDAVSVIEHINSTTSKSVEKAEAAAHSLDRIVSSVETISDRNNQIASASEEQSAVAHEIDRSIVQISQLAEHSSLSSQQIADASHELSRLGEALKEMISQFKTA